MKELGIFRESDQKKDVKTYNMITSDIKSIIDNHVKFSKSKSFDDIPEELPFLYWIPKMHKKPFSKQRYIAASYHCSTKPISSILTKCLKLVENQHRIICRRYFTSYGINPMWIIHNSNAVHENIATFNRKKECRNIKTYDFSTLYTSIPHKSLKERISWCVKEAFKSSKKSFISVYKNSARWTDKPKKGTKHYDCEEIIEMISWLIDNIYIKFGDKCFRQIIGIPMGTDCAPFLANLFLYSYEYTWIDEQRKHKKFHLLNKFKSCSRYIDDLCLINNDDLMLKVMSDIYPKELILVPDDSNGKTAPFLDLNIIIEKGNIISTSIFDKRDNFDFPIVNFPTLNGNIPHKSSYGVFVGELVRYARACTYLEDFRTRTCTLVRKLSKQYFRKKLLKIAWINFCENHILLVQKYGPSILDLHKMW